MSKVQAFSCINAHKVIHIITGMQNIAVQAFLITKCLFFKSTNLISWNMHLICMQLVQGWQHFLPPCQSAPSKALDFYLQRNITKN